MTQSASAVGLDAFAVGLALDRSFVYSAAF